jgi:hypothetical protein
VFQVLNFTSVAATAIASSSAFITHIDTIISTIIKSSVGLLGFLGSCWMYLSDPSEGSPIPSVVSEVFGATCTRKTVCLLFYAVLLRLRANPAHAADVNSAAAAPPPAGAVRLPDLNIMQRVYIGSMNGIRWFLQYLCSVPEFICIGLGGDNPIVTHINENADRLIGGWIVTIGAYIQDKFKTELSTYIQQQYFIKVFAPAFIDASISHKLDSDLFRILWAQEAERTVSGIIRYMIEAERTSNPLLNSTDELLLQHRCRNALVSVLPRCMDGMITTDDLRTHEAAQRQGAASRVYDSSKLDSDMAQPGTLDPCSDPDAEEQVSLVQKMKDPAINLLASIWSMKAVRKAGANFATLVGYCFKDDWNSEPSAKPKSYTTKQMEQLSAAPADMRRFFDRLINYIAKHVFIKLKDKPIEFGAHATEDEAYNKWSYFLDSIMRISILLKTQYKIDFDQENRLILSLNADGIEPLPEIVTWLKKLTPVEYRDPSFFNRGLFGMIGNVLSKSVEELSKIRADFFQADQEDYDAAFEICLGPNLSLLNEDSESGVAAAAASEAPDAQENTSSFFASLLTGVNLSNQGWRSMMIGGCSPVTADAERRAGADAGADAAQRAQRIANAKVTLERVRSFEADQAKGNKGNKGNKGDDMHGGKSRKNSKKTTRRNKGRKSSNTAKKSQQQRARNSIRRRRSSRKGRK